MASLIRTFTILLANDAEEVGFLVQEALQEVPFAIAFYWIESGEELLDYLYRRGQYAPPRDLPRPDLILLDWNMPRLDGRSLLTLIKSDPYWRPIPVVVLTTSYQAEDTLQAYRLGANSFIVKPLTFERLVEVMQGLCHYWFELASLPPEV